MPKLLYATIASLDGYIADEQGSFDWAEPDAEVLDFAAEREKPVGTYLYGHRTYELMVGWETDPSFAERSAPDRAFAETWQAAEKVVYSRTLEQTSTARTRLERHFDPDAVRELKRTASADLSVSGPDLAANALRAGLVDELHVYVVPAVVGGGVPDLPGGVRLGLTLAEHLRFASGFVYLRYDIDQVTPTVVKRPVVDSHD